MPFIEWTPKFELPHPLIDAQHKELLDALNRLYDAHHEGREKSEAIDALKFLVNYIDEHFTDEEELMRRADFPGFTDHKLAHNYLRKNVTTRAEAFLSGDEPDPGELLDFLASWLVNHIVGHDKKLGAHLAENE